LGGRRRQQVAAYISGLPGDTQADRVALALRWQSEGFDSFKFASPAVDDVADEFGALRKALGRDARIAADLHWQYSAAEALALARDIEPHRPWFIEAPCAPEDISGLGAVTRASPIPVAAGEEWRTAFELRDRLALGAPAIFQPEIGHTGITQFVRMATLAQASHIPIVPHATIGLGIFLSASLQASAALQGVVAHEYQHTVVPRVSRYMAGGTSVSKGSYTLPQGSGLGVEPSAECLTMLRG
jgi:galactonate dehydratase